MIYKILSRSEWDAALACGEYTGSPDDARDGFIHFSSANQLAVTAAKYFTGKRDLLLVAVDEATLGAALKWEPSRGGDLFPHLYAPLQTSHARWTISLALGPDGAPVIPDPLIPEGVS